MGRMGIGCTCRMESVIVHLMKAFVVMKPPAGKNEYDALRESLDRHFGSDGAAFELYETRKEDNPSEIVRARLRDGFDCVVAAGGDGTVSAVGDALVGSSVPLGIIPFGTGNLIARELQIPLAMEEACALIAGSPRRRKIDAMRIGGRAYFLNASVGLSAAIVGDTTGEKKRRFGFIAYIGSAILTIFKSKSRFMEVAVDGKTQKFRAVEVAIMNCGNLGKMLYPKGPEIRVDDGQLGVWILSKRTIFDYPRYMFAVLARLPLNYLAHFISAGKSVAIRSNVPLPAQADGDLIGTTPLLVEVLPAALTVLVPEKPVTAPLLDLELDRVMARYLSGFARRMRRV